MSGEASSWQNFNTARYPKFAKNHLICFRFTCDLRFMLAVDEVWLGVGAFVNVNVIVVSTFPEDVPLPFWFLWEPPALPSISSAESRSWDAKRMGIWNSCILSFVWETSLLPLLLDATCRLRKSASLKQTSQKSPCSGALGSWFYWPPPVAPEIEFRWTKIDFQKEITTSKAGLFAGSRAGQSLPLNLSLSLFFFKF